MTHPYPTSFAQAAYLPENQRDAAAAAASWLGMLFVLILTVFVLGALVRLTGAAVALPGWPLDGGALLPPLSSAGWQQRHQAFLQRAEVPQLALMEFRNLFLLTFAHRLLAILAMLVAGVCTWQLWRNRVVRRVIAWPLLGLCAILILQAVIGGLVARGVITDSTVWMHLALAPPVLAFVLWPTLQLLQVLRTSQPIPSVIVSNNQQSRFLVVMLAFAALMVWGQIVLGGMVSGTKDQGLSTTWPLLSGELVPAFSSAQPWWQDPIFVQWLHRWSAWLTALLVIAVSVLVRRSRRPLAERGRTAAYLSASLVVMQCILGVITVILGAPALLAVIHLFVAMLLWSTLVLALFDVFCESPSLRSSLPNQQATGATSADAAATLAPAAVMATSHLHSQRPDRDMQCDN